MKTITQYLVNIHKNPVFRDCINVTAIENNGAHVRANDMKRAIKLVHPNCRFFYENQKEIDRDRVGITVCANDKDRYVSYTNRFLKYGHLHLHKPLYTSQNTSGHADLHLKHLFEQLGRFRWIPKPLTDARFQTASGTHSGKDKANRLKDDLAMSFIENIYAIGVYLASPEYMARDGCPTLRLGDVDNFRHLKRKRE